MKKFIKLAFVAAVVAVAGYNVYQSQSVMKGMSEFALANVEALASGEGNGMDCKWDYIPDSYGVPRWICHEKGTGNSCTCGSVTY